MFDRDIEHPEIGWMERTGYPSFAQPEELRCEVCDCELDENDAYEDEYHEYLCKSCLVNLHSKGW